MVEKCVAIYLGQSFEEKGQVYYQFFSDSLGVNLISSGKIPLGNLTHLANLIPFDPFFTPASLANGVLRYDKKGGAHLVCPIKEQPLSQLIKKIELNRPSP